MIEWTEEAIVLAARRHGEADVVLSALTDGHGRHQGLVRGGAGRRMRGTIEPGNRLLVTWRGRLDGQLGGYMIEALDEPAGRLIDDGLRLTALGALSAVLDRSLPDRLRIGGLFERTVALIAAIEHAPETVWAAAFVLLERDLLADLGYGLDLGSCALTGGTEDLSHVSPRSGRAVSRAAGAPWAGRLLPLPGFMTGSVPLDEAEVAEIVDGLRLTLYFLDRHLFSGAGQPVPPLRIALADRLARRSGRGPSSADGTNPMEIR